MKRKLIYLFIAFAAAILPAHAQKFLNDELTLSNVSLWQQGNSLYVGMTFDMSKLTIGSTRSLSLIPLLTDGQHNVPLQEIIVNGKRREKAYIRGLAINHQRRIYRSQTVKCHVSFRRLYPAYGRSCEKP